MALYDSSRMALYALTVLRLSSFVFRASVRGVFIVITFMIVAPGSFIGEINDTQELLKARLGNINKSSIQPQECQ